MSNPFSLKGKTALITGASRGLGWATARAMAEAGAHVALNGRDPKTLAARADELAAAGYAASVAAFDVADPEAARRARDQRRFAHERIGIVHRLLVLPGCRVRRLCVSPASANSPARSTIRDLRYRGRGGMLTMDSNHETWAF